MSAGALAPKGGATGTANQHWRVLKKIAANPAQASPMNKKRFSDVGGRTTTPNRVRKPACGKVDRTEERDRPWPLLLCVVDILCTHLIVITSLTSDKSELVDNVVPVKDIRH